MKKEYKKLFVFGDSYQFGDELPQCEIPDMIQRAEAAINRPNSIWEDGRFPFGYINGEQTNILRDLEDELIQDYRKKATTLCIGGRVAQHFNISDYRNFSKNGFSNLAIAARILQNLKDIDEDTLVIVGLTHLDRSTHFKKFIGTDNDIKCFNNFRNPGESAERDQFVQMLPTYGDDQLATYIQLAVQANGISHMLESTKCKYIIIDPLNIFRENAELDGKLLKGWKFSNNIHRILENREQWEALWHTELIQELQSSFNDLFFYKTLNSSICEIAKTNKVTYCILGHPTAEVHAHFAENYLIPYLEKE